ncbi:MAG: asparagine synthase (glutamine-hydrolyzing) [Candidatus Kaistia colombiensis]|nr:MAG: asparagine synthase (glutamine-hydrolyzing) [Kaistia sp.]
MCGIFGELGQGRQADTAIYSAISKKLAHRGPDDEGIDAGDAWLLGFRRLSILDLSPSGHQPMRTPDGRFIIVFNGEIYNYRELRLELEASGVRFRSHSDTEVLLNLLARSGAKALTRLNGMFSIAFLDLQRRTFLLARDRLGVKPLYWHESQGRVRFASELKALLAWPNAPRILDRAAVAEYLSLGYLTNGSCIFKGYNKLAPGHFAEGSLDQPHIDPVRYWNITIAPPSTHEEFEEAADQDALEALLSDAVSLRLRSDVPVGIFLSGGIDSGLVAALASEVGRVPLQCLTVGFEAESHDETELARATANHLGLEFRLLQQRPPTLDDVDMMIRTFDEPFGDPSALPTMLMCAAASEHATVLLSGDGGDEAFGGYRRYIEMARYGWMSKLPGSARQACAWLACLLPVQSRLAYRLAKATLPDGAMGAVFDGQGLTRDPAFRMILPADLRAVATDMATSVTQLWQKTAGLDPLSRQRAFDYGAYLPDDVLVKVDRASMAHSIEVRSPFLDYRLVEWACHQASAALVNDSIGKLPLRRLARRKLPDRVTKAQKRGFGIPIDAWLRRPETRAAMRERLLDTDSQRPDLWDRTGVARLMNLHDRQAGRNFGDYLWRLLVLDAWSRHYLDSAAPTAPPPSILLASGPASLVTLGRTAESAQ